MQTKKLTNDIVMIFIVILGLTAVLLISGCAMKLYPVRNPDEQIEILRRVAIESYKDGMFDVLEQIVDEPKSDTELIPWDESIDLPPADKEDLYGM